MLGVRAWLIGLAICLAAWLYAKVKKAYRYWSDREIPYPTPAPFIGNFLPLLLAKRSLGQVQVDIYKKYPNERFVGYYSFMQPQLMLRDPVDVETVMVKEFSSFMDRGIPTDENRNPYSANLFGLGGTRWRAMRMKMAPTFTTGKLKGMAEQISDCWDNLANYIDRSRKEEFEFKELSSMFASDVIASTAFGIDPTKLGEPNAEFRIKARKFFDMTLARLFVFIAQINFPWMVNKLNLKFVPSNIQDYFVNIARSTMNGRRKTGYQRNDFIQLMMQLQDKGNVDVAHWGSEDDYLRFEDKAQVDTIEITESLVISQAVLFFTAGFESTSNTIAFALYELTNSPDKLKILLEEVEKIGTKYDGKFTYAALQEMPYLDQCLKETLRLHPVTPALQRMCTKKFQFSEGPSLVEKDVVSICVEGLQTDPKYWPRPMEFEPERFSPENEVNIKPFTYIPFGAGPRICIAMRFALLETKMALGRLLYDYQVWPSPDTEVPIRLNVRGFLNSPVSPIYFKLKRKQKNGVKEL